MKKQTLAAAGVKVFGSAGRAAMNIAEGGLVEIGLLDQDLELPLLIQPRVRGIDLIAWAGLNKTLINDNLRKRGGILFRGFHLESPVEFQDFISVISGELLHYTYASTPRTQVSGKIYTSTEYPSNQHIPLHNEMSYARSWPVKIWFYCETPAESGGETPIADGREVFNRISAEVRDRFARKKVMYVRNYGEGVDLSWQEAFKTSNPARVERFCIDAGIDFEWKAGGRLRTRQVCQAVTVHQASGEKVWFNQAHLFHASSLDPGVRGNLLSQFDPENLPRNACYGDGSPIEIEALEEIRKAYEQSAIIFPWRAGDILLLDNTVIAHGRRPYQGRRRVLVGMADQESYQC